MTTLEDIGEADPLRKPREEQFLRVGWLIDGQGGSIAEDQVVAIRKDRIQCVGPWRPELSGKPGLLDLSGATLLPALMDVHVHLALSGTLDEGRRQNQLRQTPGQIEQTAYTHIQAHLDNGIGAVRDGGDRSGRVLEVRNRQQTPLHLAATCWAWHAPGRYGAMIGQAPNSGKSLTQAVASACQGADHIKLLQSGINSLDHYGRRTAPQFEPDDLVAVRRFAMSGGLPVMVHANGLEAVQGVLAVGCDSIEHGYFMGPDNLRRMADQQVFWVPTLAPMDALTQPGRLTARQVDVARRTLEHQLEQVAAALKHGVPIALGTDAGSLGVDHGAAVRREMALFIDAGMSLSQAVRCATSNAAKLLGLAGRGSLHAGCSADMIVVHGSPEQLPESLASIQGLCLRGVWCKKAKNRRMPYSCFAVF